MRAGKLLALLVFAHGCASQDVVEPPPTPPQAVDTPSSRMVEAPAEERAESEAADDELGLAEYERLLAEKEDRLRAVGVLVAVREHQRDTRYAPPPPAGGIPAAEEAVARGVASKSKRAGAGPGPDPRPAPAQKTTSRARTDAPTTSATKPASAPRRNEEAFAAEPESGPQRCQTICDLSAATCDLEGKICDLAQRHAGDARYTDLCRRAEEDCRIAAEACQRCSP